MIFIRGEAREEGVKVRARNTISAKEFFCTREEKDTYFILSHRVELGQAEPNVDVSSEQLPKENAFRGTGPESIGSPITEIGKLRLG